MNDNPQPEAQEEPQHSTTIRVPESLWRKIRAKAGSEGKSANKWIAEQLDKLTQQERAALA